MVAISITQLIIQEVFRIFLLQGEKDTFIQLLVSIGMTYITLYANIWKNVLGEERGSPYNNLVLQHLFPVDKIMDEKRPFTFSLSILLSKGKSCQEQPRSYNRNNIY